MTVKAFINHAKLAITPDAASYVGKDYEKNRREKVGNAILWPARKLPTSIYEAVCQGCTWSWKQAHDPQVVTVALTAGAMLSVTAGFYPAFTCAKALAAYELGKSGVTFAINAADRCIQALPEGSIKFASYAAIQANIAGICARSLGRFANKPLMDAFYAKEHKKA